MNKLNKNVWLYSSNYTNAWWIYDFQSTQKINKIYRDYTIRKMLYVKDTLPHIMELNSSSSPITETSSDHVIYEDNDNNNNDNNDNNNNNQNDVNYVLEMGTTKYFIDIERMKQINCLDVKKQVTINRIEVPKNISNDNLLLYLKNDLKLNIKN